MTLSRYNALVRRSFLCVLGILACSLVLVYAISPRRDPSFVPTSSNAGSLVSWAAGIPETTWTRGMGALAVVLAINLVLVMLGSRAGQRFLMRPGRSSIVPGLITGATALVLCAGFAYTLWFGMVLYLLTQSIVD
jgi:hypothetical protein